VTAAVGRCWASLDSERAVAYRRKQGVADEKMAMAVVVQRLVPSEVSGVLFTKDPMDADGKRMLVEASWGLGESVVSGRVMPDRFHLDHESGAVLDRHINAKTTMQTAAGVQPVPDDKQSVACLNDAQLAELAELGRKVEAFYGDARDVEWAWAEGRFWLLQGRPITTGGAAERAEVQREEVAALQKMADPGGTVWARFNLAEILPEPTPMTWSVVRRFMSGKGGFGLMYRDLGFDPDPALDDIGVYDLICGRPYCNLSREPRMQFRRLPFEHPFAMLKAEPGKALYPQPLLNSARWGFWFWLAVPWIAWQLARPARRMAKVSKGFAERFRTLTLPTFAREVDAQAALDLTTIDSSALLDRLHAWMRRVLDDYAREGLKPTALAAMSMANLEGGLTLPLGKFDAEKARAAVGQLTMGVRPDPEADLPGAVSDLGAGRIDRATFLQQFGHRGQQEMELSRPRWSEDHTAIDRMIGQSASAGHHGANHLAPRDSTSFRQRGLGEVRKALAEQPGLEAELAQLHTFLALRETAKHYLMKGYAQVRRILLELDRRHSLAGGIFYLTLEELPRLVKGEKLADLIAQRQKRRTLALSLDVPQVVFSDDLEAIGRPVKVSGATSLQGVALSAGVTEGPALVLLEPTDAEVPSDPYILVCPTTDPAWVPLFVHAKGLVMETGGVLSHGAIVAREFGLPAVAGLPDIQRRLRTGQRLRIDGGTGTVTVLS
jgi:pyruvate,water dikinase